MEIDSVENSNKKNKVKKKTKTNTKSEKKVKPKSKSIIKKSPFDIENEISKTEAKLPSGLSKENMDELKMFIRSEVK
jgi:hypothetical protein